jgi:hypothetical protein
VFRARVTGESVSPGQYLATTPLGKN